MLESDPWKLILLFRFISMASLNNQSVFSHVFNLLIIESAFCSNLFVFARISVSITEIQCETIIKKCIYLVDLV